jgi:hypothetical protein
MIALMRKISFKKADKSLQKSIIEHKKSLMKSFERVGRSQQGTRQVDSPEKPGLIHHNTDEINELKKTTIPLMVAVAISNIMYTSLHSFLPIYIETHFPTLSSIHFSTIIAIFEVANLLTSLILGL